MNRRGFFRTIAGALGAIVGRKALPPAPLPEVQLPASYAQSLGDQLGLSLRFIRHADPVNGRVINRVDVLYGVGTLQPEYAVRVVEAPCLQVRFDPARLPL